MTTELSDFSYNLSGNIFGGREWYVNFEVTIGTEF